MQSYVLAHNTFSYNTCVYVPVAAAVVLAVPVARSVAAYDGVPAVSSSAADVCCGDELFAPSDA